MRNNWKNREKISLIINAMYQILAKRKMVSWFWLKFLDPRIVSISVYQKNLSVIVQTKQYKIPKQNEEQLEK